MEGGLGKVDRDFLRRVLVRHLGAKNSDVIVGPGMGLDNAVLSIGPGRVMVVTADPLSMIPSIGMEDSAWLTVHELASDLATSAVRPQFVVLDYNLPPSLRMDDFERYVKAVGKECSKLGVSIIGGHTGKYPGSDFSVVGGGMMMGIAGDREYVTPSMIQEGDDLIMTKGSAIEATAVLARAFPKTVEEKLGKAVSNRARAYFGLCSTVQDAVTASSVGLRSDGVTSMHDATEGGVLGALYELAQSSKRTVQIDKRKVIVSEESARVCGMFGLDPLVTVSEGTLLVTCRPHRSPEVLRRLLKKGISAAVIGSAGKRGQGRLLVSSGAKGVHYVPPKLDPYWEVYARGIEKGWK
ncbi:MAG: AIR synthase family protein [Thaumarchaeota archaeon]|nr:AIR synthase family protein [Nitrososphaerota archaeon]